MLHLQTNPVSSQSHLQRPDHTISAETTTTLLRHGLVSQIVGALKTMNGTACNGYDVTMFDDNDDYHIKQQQNTNVNRPFCAEENDQCLKCKPIIEKLKQEIKELWSSQMPGELLTLSCNVFMIFYILYAIWSLLIRGAFWCTQTS